MNDNGFKLERGIKNSDNELVDAARHPKEILRIPCDKKVSKNDLLRVNFLG